MNNVDVAVAGKANKRWMECVDSHISIYTFQPSFLYTGMTEMTTNTEVKKNTLHVVPTK